MKRQTRQKSSLKKSHGAQRKRDKSRSTNVNHGAFESAVKISSKSLPRHAIIPNMEISVEIPVNC